MAPASSGKEQQHISEYKGNHRTIYTTSAAEGWEGQPGLSEQSSRGERRILDIFCKPRGGTEGSRQQLALGQGHCSTPTASGTLQVLPFPQLMCTEGQGGAQEAKQDLC